MALEYACPKLRENKSVVKAAIRQNGMALEFASNTLRDDVDVALIAVRQNGLALKYVSERLTHDLDVVLAAVRRTGLALKYASLEMRNDGEVVTAAILRDSRAVKFLGSEYTSGRKKLVVSTTSAGKQKVGDLDSLADEIAKRVMVDASRDWSEERSDRQRNEREMMDKVLASRTPKSKGGFSFFGNMKQYFFQPKPAMTSAPVEAREETEAIQHERSANNTKKFTFFENMGKYIDNSCQTGCGCIQSMPETGTCQTKLSCMPEKNDLVLEERTPAELVVSASQKGASEKGDIDLIVERQIEAREMVDAVDHVKELNDAGVKELGDGMINTAEVTMAEVSVNEVSETIIPDGMIIALREKETTDDKIIKTGAVKVDEVNKTNIEDGMIIALKEKEAIRGSPKKRESTTLHAV